MTSHPPPIHRRAAAFLFLLAALLTVACGDRDAALDPVRIAELLPPPSAEQVVLAENLAVGEEPVNLEMDLEAAPVSRLRVRARGDAQLVRMSWRLAGERRFTPYRALTFPVRPGAEAELYEIDLRREPYWTGRIAELRFTTDGGTVEIASVEGLSGRSRHRLTSLKGLTIPSLPGTRRVEVTLPADLPDEVDFETWVGLLPRFDRGEVSARFRAWAVPAGADPDDPAQRIPWLDQEVTGQRRAVLRGWQRVRQRVTVPAGGRLILEVEAERDGHPLPEGSAVWGAPLLLPTAGGEAMNLLLVVVDTLRADVLGSYGDPGGLTPHLDAFAERSARFTGMHAPAPWTLPSIATLLTGQQPHVHGAGRRIGDFAPTALGDALPTLAEQLTGRGYYAAGVYNNIYLNPSFGLERGFDEYRWVEDGDEVIVDHALERLEELQHRKLFFFVHLFGPHHPYEPPPEECRSFAESFAPGYAGELGCAFERVDVPTLGGTVPAEGDWRWIEGLYRAEVAHTDRQLGRLLAGLEELGLGARTVVAVVSDHGEAFYDRVDQLDAHGYAQADHGNTHFEELLRVPALVHVPDLAPTVVAGATELADLTPTLLGLLGLPGFETPPAEIRTAGRDLGPRLGGGAPSERPTLLSDRILYGPSRWAARRGPWKLVLPADGASLSEGAAPELYDLASDPGEQHDVAGDHPEVVRDLEALARRELAAREELRRRLSSDDEDVLNAAYLEWNQITKLRALGYLK